MERIPESREFTISRATFRICGSCDKIPSTNWSTSVTADCTSAGRLETSASHRLCTSWSAAFTICGNAPIIPVISPCTSVIAALMIERTALATSASAPATPAKRF